MNSINELSYHEITTISGGKLNPIIRMGASYGAMFGFAIGACKGILEAASYIEQLKTDHRNITEADHYIIQSKIWEHAVSQTLYGVTVGIATAALTVSNKTPD